MNKIASFCINHDRLRQGIYLSRIDGDVLSYDLRMKKPNNDDYLDQAGLHTLEHLFATYMRNSSVQDHVVYIGPMGCRTGFCLLLTGDYESADIVPLMQEMFLFIRDFEGEVPGASARDCGNYLDMNLPVTKRLAGKFYDEILENITDEHLIYPD